VRDATLVSVLAYAGLRPQSEAITLRWEQIQHRTIGVDASKTGKTRYVNLCAPLAADLKLWRERSSGKGLVFPTRRGVDGERLEDVGAPRVEKGG
jgi:integrase